MKTFAFNSYSHKHNYYFLAIIAIAYYFLIRQYVGPVEDVFYAYMHSANASEFNDFVIWDKPITSFSDAIKQQSVDYFALNGRIVTHTIVPYLIAMPWGKEAYFIICTVSFILLISGMTQLVRMTDNRERERERDWSVDSLIILLFFFIFIPVPGRTIFGHIDFTANYLWPSSCIVWMLIWFNKLKNNETISNRKLIFLGIFALISGALHEGFSLPMSAVLFFYLCFNYRKASNSFYIITIAFWIGTTFTTFAPANFVRAGESKWVIGFGLDFLPKTILVTKTIICDSIFTDIFILLTIITLIWRKKLKDYLDDNWQYMVIGMVSLCFDIFIAYCGSHQLIPIVIVSILMVTNFTFKYAQRALIKYRKSISITIIIGLIGSYPMIYYYRNEMVKAWEEMHDASKNASDYLNANKLHKLTYRIPLIFQPFINDYCFYHINTPQYYIRSSLIATKGQDPYRYTYTLPDTKENIISACNKTNEVSNNLYRKDNFTIAKIPLSQLDSTQIEVKYNSLVRKLLGRPSITEIQHITSNSKSFNDKDTTYVLLPFNTTKLESIKLVKQKSH